MAKKETAVIAAEDRADKFVERILSECRKEKYTIGEVQNIAWGIQHKVDEIRNPRSYQALAKVKEELF